MKLETLEALRGSISKWQRIAAGQGVDRGPLDCPLCHLFNPPLSDADATPRKCDGCPVKQATGRSYCQGSPYWIFWEADEPGVSLEYLRGLAAAERDFLISLLPSGAGL